MTLHDFGLKEKLHTTAPTKKLAVQWLNEAL
jgi:hypothetical protein